jgi:hypothetical protein
MVTGVHSLCETHLIPKCVKRETKINYNAWTVEGEGGASDEQQVTEIYIEAILAQATSQTASYPERGE